MKFDLGFGSGVQTVEIPDANVKDVLLPNPVSYDLSGADRMCPGAG